MGVSVSLPGALAPYAEGRRRVAIEPPFTTVGQALEQVWRLYPGLRDRVLTEEGAVRRHVNVFVGTDSIRDTGGLGTPVVDGVEIAIIPAVSGGAINPGCGALRFASLPPSACRAGTMNTSAAYANVARSEITRAKPTCAPWW